MALHDAAIGQTFILDNTEVAVLFFLRVIERRNIERYYADGEGFEKGAGCSTTARFAAFRTLDF
jgi:hypothetical protein